MKKLLLICFLLPLTLLSCSKDKNEEPQNNPLIGTWYAVGISTNGGYFTEWLYDRTFMSFVSNGRFVSVGIFGSINGKWDKTGDIVNLYDDTGEIGYLEIKEVSVETCILNVNMDGTSLIIKWKNERYL